MVVATELNVWLALVPTAVMATRLTTMIRASMTAYSTAVGPSSRRRNSTTLCTNFDMTVPLLVEETEAALFPAVRCCPGAAPDQPHPPDRTCPLRTHRTHQRGV